MLFLIQNAERRTSHFERRRSLPRSALRLIASGSLLIVVAEPDVDRVQQALAARGTPVARIGQVTRPEAGLRLDGVPFGSPECDEIARALK